MMEKQYVVFTLDGEEYGVDIIYVKEISQWQKSSKVPQTPNFIEGIINYRGVVTPIINLRKKFQLEAQEADDQTRIIIIHLKQKQVGFQVDEASQVLTISSDVIESSLQMVTGIQGDFIEGIAKLEDRMIILLDLEKVLSEEEREKILEMNTPAT